jgi:hypothetical protein
MQANYKMTVAALALSSLGLMVSGIGTGFAQNMVRVRGTIDHIDGPTYLVKARDGAELKVALADNPQIAGVVFLEHGIHGPNAATVARHILNTFFAKQDGKPLPVVPTHEEMRLDFKDPYARGGSGPVGGNN